MSSACAGIASADGSLISFHKEMGIVAEIFREIEGATLDRVHFFSYGDFSLIFEIVYYIDGNDYTRYMDIQQKVNLRIFEEFGKRKIEFAYPTQTLYLNKA